MTEADAGRLAQRYRSELAEVPRAKAPRRAVRHGDSVYSHAWMNWYWSRGLLPFDGPSIPKELRMRSHRRAI